MNRVERLIEIARKKKRVVIGLMSGTSVDAIDAVLVRIEGNARDGARIEKLRFGTFGFPPEIQTRIKLLFERERDRKLTDPETGEHPAPWTIEEICHLDFVLGVCRQWVRSTDPHTRWIVKDGLRKLKASRPRDVAVVLGALD